VIFIHIVLTYSRGSKEWKRGMTITWINKRDGRGTVSKRGKTVKIGKG
jgi:hypothetical protein